MDNIRTIAILPAVTKLLETIVLEKLKPYLYGRDGMIAQEQQGFRPGAGTYVQLANFLKLVETAK